MLLLSLVVAAAVVVALVAVAVVVTQVQDSPGHRTPPEARARVRGGKLT